MIKWGIIKILFIGKKNSYFIESDKVYIYIDTIFIRLLRTILYLNVPYMSCKKLKHHVLQWKIKQLGYEINAN